MPDNLIDRIIAFIPVLLSLSVHEWAHAWTAWKLGDDTAYRLGRVTLNPLAHIDPIGTVLLPLMGVPFGWAKPVPFDPTRFRPEVNMTTGTMLVAAAGPISNLVQAALGCVVFFALSRPSLAFLFAGLTPDAYESVVRFVMMYVVINVLLAAFNLIPVPPLDGSKIADALMPAALRPAWSQFMQLGPIGLLAVIFLPRLLGIDLFYWPMLWTMSLLKWLQSI